MKRVEELAYHMESMVEVNKKYKNRCNDDECPFFKQSLHERSYCILFMVYPECDGFFFERCDECKKLIIKE